MRITFKLYASLTQYLPAENRYDNRVQLDLPEGSAVAQVIEPFGLPEKLAGLGPHAADGVTLAHGSMSSWPLRVSGYRHRWVYGGGAAGIQKGPFFRPQIPASRGNDGRNPAINEPIGSPRPVCRDPTER